MNDSSSSKYFHSKFLTNKNKSLPNIFYEKRGDITKKCAPAYSFGIARDDCITPFAKIQEKISPSVGSYNLRKLSGGMGGSSIKYSINKENISKNFNYLIKRSPGPGHYNINNNDTKNNGHIFLSNFANSPICNFGKYREIRGKDIIGHSDYFIRPDPTTYNVNSEISMFKKNGRYPLSTFKSNGGKSIDKCNYFSVNGYHRPTPGPGSYNHYSSFLGHKF